MFDPVARSSSTVRALTIGCPVQQAAREQRAGAGGGGAGGRRHNRGGDDGLDEADAILRRREKELGHEGARGDTAADELSAALADASLGGRGGRRKGHGGAGNDRVREFLEDAGLERW